MMAVGLPGIDDEADHSILFLHKEKSSEGTCSCPKAQHLRVGELVKQLSTLARVSAQRGIPLRRDGTLRLLEMQQLSRTPDFSGTRVTEHLGKRGAHQVNCVFRQDSTLGDPQLVEVVVRC